MLTLPTMSQVIAWFGWGHGVGALAGISAILTVVVIVAPVIAGAEVTEMCMFESGHGQLGHICYRSRGPWFMRAVQCALIGVAPTVVGFTLGYFQGVWIFIVPLFLLFFGLGYFG